MVYSNPEVRSRSSGTRELWPASHNGLFDDEKNTSITISKCLFGITCIILKERRVFEEKCFCAYDFGDGVEGYFLRENDPLEKQLSEKFEAVSSLIRQKRLKKIALVFNEIDDTDRALEVYTWTIYYENDGTFSFSFGSQSTGNAEKVTFSNYDDSRRQFIALVRQTYKILEKLGPLPPMTVPTINLACTKVDGDSGTRKYIGFNSTPTLYNIKNNFISIRVGAIPFENCTVKLGCKTTLVSSDEDVTSTRVVPTKSTAMDITQRTLGYKKTPRLSNTPNKTTDRSEEFNSQVPFDSLLDNDNDYIIDQPMEHENMEEENLTRTVPKKSTATMNSTAKSRSFRTPKKANDRSKVSHSPEPFASLLDIDDVYNIDKEMERENIERGNTSIQRTPVWKQKSPTGKNRSQEKEKEREAKIAKDSTRTPVRTRQSPFIANRTSTEATAERQTSPVGSVSEMSIVNSVGEKKKMTVEGESSVQNRASTENVVEYEEQEECLSVWKKRSLFNTSSSHTINDEYVPIYKRSDGSRSSQSSSTSVEKVRAVSSLEKEVIVPSTVVEVGTVFTEEVTTKVIEEASHETTEVIDVVEKFKSNQTTPRQLRRKRGNDEDSDASLEAVKNSSSDNLRTESVFAAEKEARPASELSPTEVKKMLAAEKRRKRLEESARKKREAAERRELKKKEKEESKKKELEEKERIEKEAARKIDQEKEEAKKKEREEKERLEKEAARKIEQKEKERLEKEKAKKREREEKERLEKKEEEERARFEEAEAERRKQEKLAKKILAREEREKRQKAKKQEQQEKRRRQREQKEMEKERLETARRQKKIEELAHKSTNEVTPILERRYSSVSSILEVTEDMAPASTNEVAPKLERRYSTVPSILEQPIEELTRRYASVDSIKRSDSPAAERARDDMVPKTEVVSQPIDSVKLEQSSPVIMPRKRRFARVASLASLAPEVVEKQPRTGPITCKTENLSQ